MYAPDRPIHERKSGKAGLASPIAGADQINCRLKIFAGGRPLRRRRETDALIGSPEARPTGTIFSLMFGVVRSGSLLMSLDELEQLQSAIRDIADFPKPGIIFKDITPILGDGKLFRCVIDHLAGEAEKANPTKVVGIDARGFLFGAAVAYKLGVGCVPIRKKGKLPFRTIGSSYQLEYGDAEVEMHVDAIVAGERVVLVDDLLATGGTSGAAINLVQKIGGIVGSALFVVELTFLHGREKLPPDVPVHSLVKY